MKFIDLVKSTRSFRKFRQDHKIDIKTLKELVNLARLSASSGNIQGLKFILSADEDKNALIFKHLKWAYHYKDWDGPEEGQRPSGYIIILGDTDIHATIDVDVGIAAQSIVLGATDMGLGACMFGSIDRKGLRKCLKIPQRFQIPLIIALGKPDEHVVLEEVNESGSIVYWRDENNVHHVPKRSLDDIILK